MENNQESVKNYFDTEEYKQKLQQLLDSMSETVEEGVIRHHRHCGSHSNIPPCCVEFFIKYWRGSLPESFIGSIYRFLKQYWYPVNRMPQYVVCPKCLIKRHAQPLHECDWKEGSIRVGECKPTGRILGFRNNLRLSDMSQSNSA